MTGKNRQWRLRSHPEGMPQADNWQLQEAPVPVPEEGQILARAIYLDVAPYMRGRISLQKNYVAGVRVGGLMVGGGLGEVIESKCDEYRPGDLVVTDFSFRWQEYSALRPAVVRRVDPAVAPLPYWLDALGLNGVTAYFALGECARALPGDTVVISAAGGSVGQIAGQIARLSGCRVIGLTSTEEKAAWCREIGYDDVILYPAEPDLAAAVGRACPHGVNVFIDNTAGPIHDAVLQNLAAHARIALVGSISNAVRYGQPDIGPRYLRQFVAARATMSGFLVSDYQHRYEEARRRLAYWVQTGVLKSRFDISEGIESMPQAFLRLLESRNLGKQLVQVSEDRWSRGAEGGATTS